MTVNPHLGDAGWLRHGEVARLMAALDRDGEEARVVGGAVRNALLHLAVDEVDLATTAVPADVVRRVTAAGWKAIPTGIDHGTVTVVIDGKPFEVTTLRQDVETDGRHAKVAFGRDWRMDAQRRDFTINALSAAPDGTVYDYVGGIADIATRRVRFIGEAKERIAEDYLRILRFFRFHAWYGEGLPDAAGLHACILARAGLDTLSRERVRMEALKLLLARRATPTLAVMGESGILGAVLGGVPWLASFENLVKAETAMNIAPDAVRRLGALAVRVREDGERLAQRLRLANAEGERLVALEQWWRVTPAAGDQAARALLYRLGPQAFTDRILIAWSRAPAGTADPAWHALADLPNKWTAPEFPLKSADFIKRGIVPGPALGRAIRSAEAAWIAADFPAQQAVLEVIADKAAGEAAAAG
ncbi:MAG TPA: CCA tRNA nucleotidyltransferase [Xanthobacteraceae bacterium]|nr:CCA tRNA nucleotidyltransferase [Xanthobacteraceae bacterium]